MLRHHRRLAAIAVTGAVASATLLGGGVAYAAWAETGSGEGAAAAASLGTPASVSATATSSSAIQISWNAPASGPTPTSYQVVRNGTTTLSCTSSPCTDSGLAAGSYNEYVVSSKLGDNWVKTATKVAATTDAAAQQATTTTVSSSQNPAKSGSTVTLTATVATSPPGGGTPTGGTVTFKRGATTISCSGGNQTLTIGSATCATSFASMGAYSITAEYSGSAGFEPSQSNGVTQRVVNGNVTGLNFTNVKVGTTSAAIRCSGSPASRTCTVNGSHGNNAKLTADIQFVTAAGTAAYASDQSTTMQWTSTGKAPQTGSVVVNANASASTSAAVAAEKNGSNAATVTVTLDDGANTFSASLTIN